MIDIFNPEVSILTRGMKGKTILLWGPNRSGKTYCCSKANKSVFVKFENGLNGLDGVRGFTIDKWTDWTSFVKQLTNPANKEKVKEIYETIVVDTIDRMFALGEEYVCNVYNVIGVDRDSSGKKGFGIWKEYRQEVMKWINLLTNSGFTVVFIGHEDTRTLKDDMGEDYAKLYPRGDRKSVDFIADACDIICYARPQPNSEDGKEVKSTLYLKGNSSFLAGSRFTHVPNQITEWSWEKLETVVAKAIEEQEKESGIASISYEEAEEKATILKEPKKKMPLDDMIEKIGKAVEDLNSRDGNIEKYYKLLETEVGTREFRVSDATEKQREQVEQILNAIEKRGF